MLSEFGCWKFIYCNNAGLGSEKIAVTADGEAAKIHNYLDEEKIQSESLYNELYAVSTDLLDMNFAGVQEQGFIPLSNLFYSLFFIFSICSIFGLYLV